MVAYLDECNLVAGRLYKCELYSGEHIVLCYEKDGEFSLDEDVFVLDGDVRYVWER